MDNQSAKQIVLEKTDINLQPEMLEATQVNEEPNYWFVSLLDENSQPLIGGESYVVNTDGKVYKTTGSLPPSIRLNEAKAWFSSN